MIFIDLEGFTPSAQWSAKALAHQNTIQALATIDEKNEYITNIWSEIKDDLLNIPYARKCWFSESVENVSDYHVEHFRPKKRVDKSNIKIQNTTFGELQRNGWTDVINHTAGYWWLAFNHKNYRIAGSKINSSFKKNYFPLREGSLSVAYSDADDYSSEEHVLLDPTKKGDPELLSFEPDGKAIGTYYYDVDLWKYIRAEASIIIYGLNDIQELKNARLEKWQKCSDLINETQKNYFLHERMVANGIDVNNENELLMFIRLEESLTFFYTQLKNELDATSAFSSVAVTCLKSFNYPWIATNVFN